MHITQNNFDIKTIANSGQCFRFHKISEQEYRVIAKNKVLHLSQPDENTCVLDCNAHDFAAIWQPYFDFDTDYSVFVRSAAPDDIFLQNAVQYGKGMRILRQDAFEMLITFIISQRKNIPAIKQCVETLCTQFGRPIEPAEERAFAFPTPQALAAQSVDTLRACALGYRAPYVQTAAKMVASGALDLNAAQKMDDESLYQLLLTVPGVGPKVANCVMLFGFYRIASFPRDVWINRMIDAEYGGVFPLERYSGYAGVIQQYIFYYARSNEYSAR
ncbi:MAG: DNA glycosylase [Ruthenibacterium sp.]